MRLRRGDIFRVHKAHDNGGAPYVVVLSTRPLIVQDYDRNGEVFRQPWGYVAPRRFDRSTLLKYWVHATPPAEGT